MIKLKYLYVVFVFLSISILGCKNRTSNRGDCRWIHSQIVGHMALKEQPNSRISAVYIAVKCPNIIPENSFLLKNKRHQITLNVDDITPSFIILKADINSIDRFLGKKIRDSVEYKKTLSKQLEEAYLLVKETGEPLPKGNNYKNKIGYIIKRK